MEEIKIGTRKTYIGKRLLSSLMIIAMVVTSMFLPQNVYKVYADTIGAPSAATYMDNSSGNPYKKYSKVYFGKVDASTLCAWSTHRF